MPETHWFTRVLYASLIGYVATTLLIVAGRIRHDRRRMLAQRISSATHAWLTRPADAEWPPLLSGAPLGALFRYLDDMQPPNESLRVCAQAIVRRVGERRLCRQASRGFTWRRIAALRALAFADSPAAWPLLERAIRHPRGRVTRAAVMTLGRLSHRRGAELLIERLRVARRGRAQIAALLDTFPLDVSDLLVPLLDDPNPILRYWAATLAARYAGSPHMEQRLRVASGDSDSSVRKAAVDALCAGGCTASVDALLPLLDDDVPFVRAHAVLALGRLGGVSYLQPIAERLGDTDWSTRDAAKRVLEEFGQRAEPALIERLFDADRVARDSAAEVLQNLGTLERLLTLHASQPCNVARLAQLRRLAGAVAGDVWDTVLASVPEDVRARVAPLVDAARREADHGVHGE